ncbi:MAG: beta-ketoacyl-[acyl-carrier-protein] synthase family protein [Desulfobacterales bacterium]|nr:beta-ketoacyl-[acyl-carrier-protein] synthase family protein [Desulfobacterales bacterium]
MGPLPPVAIAGIGCICSAGLTLKDSMRSLYRGERRPAPPTCFSAPPPFAFPVFEILEDFFPGRKIKEKNILRTCKLAVTAALEAMADAGFDRKFLKKKRVGVCIGTNVGSCVNNEAFYLNNGQGDALLSAPAGRFLASNPTRVIAAEFCAGGPLQTVVNACSAGSDAIGLAASWIRTGLCDVVIAGGADELYQVTYTGFKSLLIYDDSPCRPFDANRKGLNLGEGAAIFILTSEKIQQEARQKPRGFVLGYGCATDAYHPTKTRPDGLGLKMAIQEAVEAGGTTLAEIAFVSAHGTGTRDNDLIESRVLNDLLPGVPFFSTKGYTGHTLGASGAIAAAFTVACLEEGRIPASAGFSTPDPELAPAYPVRRNFSISGRIALSETLAFGGSNAVLILETGK